MIRRRPRPVATAEAHSGPDYSRRQRFHEEDSMGTTEILARHIVETTYGSLPAEVVRAAKDVILDGVGVMLAI